MPTDAGFPHHFEAGTVFHWTTVVVCVGSMVVACVGGRRALRLDRLDHGRREFAWRTAIGLSIVGWQGFATVWRLLPEQWDLNESLPLHLCRVNAWVAAWVLLAGPAQHGASRVARSLLFFWGLGLSVQGFLTPMWNDGLLTTAFWLYWVGHTQIVGASMYDLWVHRFVPRRRDLFWAMGLGLLYVGAVFLVNRGLDTNYSYLGSWDYDRASIVDKLSDYPKRVVQMAGGAIILFVVMFGVARLVASVRTRRGIGALQA